MHVFDQNKYSAKNNFLFIDAQIENHALRFQENAQSKYGTFDYLDHQPGGGNKKVFSLALLHYIIYIMICSHGAAATLLKVFFVFNFIVKRIFIDELIFLLLYLVVVNFEFGRS